MNSLESTKPTAFFWHRRRTLEQIKHQAPFFRQLMAETKRCMVENRMSQAMNPQAIKNAIKCEVIHPQTLTSFTDWTYHTHPSNIAYPSEQDKIQTRKLNKDYISIGIVPLMKIVVFHKDDNFEREIARF